MGAPVRFIPLGGLGEIGMNCMAIECEGRIVVLDCGVLFDGRGLGVDVIHADWEWLLERRADVLALVLTHGHEDHLGAVSYFLRDFDVPVYGPPYAIALVKQRTAEHVWHRARKLDLRVLDRDGELRLGALTFRLFEVTHSMPDCFGVILETPQGIVVHTGDFKIDDEPGPGDRFAWERLEGLRGQVRLVLSDSTNALNEGASGGERLVRHALEEHIRAATGRVIVGLFASNGHRLRMLAELARATGRSLVPLGRSIDTHLRIAEEVGFLPDPHDVLVLREKAARVPRGSFLGIATGSQGEAPAALARLAQGTHSDVQLDPGDLVILSARIIPGNEKSVLDLIEQLERRGVRVLHRGIDPRVHVSGHAHRDEQRRLLETLAPETFLPVHGTFVHLRAHAELARSVGVGEAVVALNGDIVELSDQGLRKAGHVWSGRVHIDRGGEPVDGQVLAERKGLAELGQVVVTGVVDAKSRLVGKPRVSARGVLHPEDDDLIGDMVRAVEKDVGTLRSPKDVIDDSSIEEAMRRAVRRVLFAELGKKPVVTAHVHRLRASV